MLYEVITEATDRLTLFSNMVVFSSYAMQVIMAFLMLVMIFIMLPRASVSAKRVNEVLDTKPTIKDGHVTEGRITSYNVCYTKLLRGS